ncbi:hypothetical protein SAMD00023353_2400470 [Rosellinia necatrix]|uniref:Uncharacterized protein n=1 Tax=Rosellinia necatrix TaxID=77044 RepID=A0A1W2TFQ7_ROSNE|nr:hypothetical protein SAMD00023353_2400470 [Rosellinia necatrix]
MLSGVIAPVALPLGSLAVEIPREEIANELEKTDLPSLVDSFGSILSKSNVRFRRTVEADPKTIHDVARPDFGLSTLTKKNARLASTLANIGDREDLPSILFKKNAAVIGGAIVHDINLVVGEDKNRFGNLPLLPIQVPLGYKARLFSREPENKGEAPVSMLLFPEHYTAPPGFENVNVFGEEAKTADAASTNVATSFESDFQDSMAKSGMKMTDLKLYTISGDIVDFWGIKGLTAKLYKYKGVESDAQKEGDTNSDKEVETENDPVREKIVIDSRSLAFAGKPLATLFPYIESEDIKNLPIANLELTYSEDETKNPLYQPGLRLELDVQLKGCLKWAGDAIKNLFGSLDTPPTIHLSAWLSKERNWSKPPQIENLILQGYFKDMSLKAWNILEFQTLGMELTALKSANSWNFGFGLIGEVAVTGIPEAQVPLKLSYRIARDIGSDEDGDEGEGEKNPSRIWNLTINASEWKGIFGYNIELEGATLFASFDEGHFASSVALDIAGVVKLGDGRFDIHGRFAKDWKHAVTWTWVDVESKDGVPMKLEDHFIEASIGDLTLSDIKKLYSQITGQEGSRDSEDHNISDDELKFKAMKFRISSTKYANAKLNRKAIELSGEVTVGDATSYSANLTFATEGITVTGAVSNVRIPDTDIFIEKAGLNAFLALKGGKDLQTGESDSRSKSSLSILGVIKYHEVTFKAGFHTAKDENKERDWLVFGSAQRIRLREVWPSIPEDSFLNLQLDNVTVIASAKSRKRRSKKLPKQINDNNESEKDSSTDVADEDAEAGVSSETHANWDVMAEVEAYDYPVKQGFQICATISNFQQLEELNNGNKVDGLMIALSYDTKGEIAASLRLPSSFQVSLSACAYLSDFSASIGSSTEDGMYLELRATLIVNMEDSDPFSVQGIIVGTFTGAHGALVMDPSSQWINPFSLNKELIVSNLGIEIGFDYATVFVVGPTRFALKGQLNIREYQYLMNVGVDVTKAAGVLNVEIAKLDIADIVKIAGILLDDAVLAQEADQAKGLVVFSDLKLYLSSGATFMGEYYSRGIQVRGKLNFFDKQGEFDGTFTEDGVVIKGGLDAFKIGGLEVTSLKEYKGKKRATINIETTKSMQKILIDGIIRYDDIELQVYINADLEQKYFDFDIYIKLADALQFTLKGDVKVNDPNELESAVVHFEAHLEAKIIEIIGEGIINSINALEEQAKHAIEEAETKIRERLTQLNDELAQRKEELDEMRRQSHLEVLAKRQKVAEENDFLRRTYDEIDEFKRKYEAAKDRKDRNEDEMREQMAKRDAAMARLSEKKREMRDEYDRKINEQRSNQARWQSERNRLTQQKEASWGDILRKKELADANWRYWTQIEEERYNWKLQTMRNLDECGLFDKAYWLAKLGEATLGLEQAHGSKIAETEILHAVEAVTSSDEFKTVEHGINDAAYEVSRFGRALDGLIAKGPMGYIEEMTHDDRVELDRQISLCDKLMALSRELEEELRTARKALEDEKGRLRPEQEEARKRIVRLEAEIKLKPFEEAYKNKQQDYERIKIMADALVDQLEDIEKGINVGADVLRQVTKVVMEGLPDIREIHVKASSDALVKHEPLLFSVTVRWMGQDHTCRVEWAPNQDAHELYESAAKSVVAIADD